MARTGLAFALALSLSAAACDVGLDIPLDDDDEVQGANTATLRIVQHNIEKKDAALYVALDEAERIDADGIALQEVCPSQVQWLVDGYSTVWTIVAIQAPKAALVGCDLPGGLHDRTMAVAIWRGGPAGTPAWFPNLARVPDAPGDMACVEFPRGGVAVDLCSTHLNSTQFGTYSGEELRQRETTRIKQIARDNWLTKGNFVIVAGDFNGKPYTPPLKKMYDPALGGKGDFTEYNRSGATRDGRNTAHSSGDNTETGEGYDRKIDYIFFSTNRAPIDGEVAQVTRDTSDHDMVTSVVRMRKKR